MYFQWERNNVELPYIDWIAQILFNLGKTPGPQNRVSCGLRFFEQSS